MKLFLVTAFEFVYVITVLIFSANEQNCQQGTLLFDAQTALLARELCIELEVQILIVTTLLLLYIHCSLMKETVVRDVLITAHDNPFSLRRKPKTYCTFYFHGV